MVDRNLTLRVDVDLASLFQALLASWVGPGFRFMVDTFLVVILLPGHNVGILFRFTSFLSTLHWPTGSDDMGHFDVSFFLKSYPFLSNGLDTGCSVKR